MHTVSIQDIKKRGTKSFPKHGASFVIANSKPAGVLMPVEEYENLIELIEDYLDVQAYEKRKDEETLPFNEVKKKLQLGEYAKVQN